MIVCKFGGSVILGKKGVNFIKKQVSLNQERKIIVVSAIGKGARKSDKKLTDLLFEAYYNRNTKAFNRLFEKIMRKIINFCKKLQINYCDIICFDNFKKNFSNKSVEWIVSRGEYYTAKIVAKYLNYRFLPSENILIGDKFDYIDLYKCKINIIKEDFSLPCVVPGYYYSSPNNKICLFKRGGGDVSAAVIAKLLNCSKYENYTNVNGILTFSPSIYTGGQTIKNMTYFQAYLCTKSGATVFANEAIKYLFNSSVKTYIMNAKNSNKLNSEIGSNSTFYYLHKCEKFYKYNQHKKTKKHLLIQAFFNDFMSHNSDIYELIYYKNSIYYLKKNSMQNMYDYCLKLFNCNNKKIVKNIRSLCKEYKIKFIKKGVYYKFNYQTFYLIGNCSNDFFKKMNEILKGLTTQNG